MTNVEKIISFVDEMINRGAIKIDCKMGITEISVVIPQKQPRTEAPAFPPLPKEEEDEIDRYFNPSLEDLKKHEGLL